MLTRILSLYRHFAAFGVDAEHFERESALRREVRYLADWITPKLIVKGDGVSEREAVCRDNLWSAINTVHGEEMEAILRAISFYCSPSVFVQWFKYLLTVHFKALAAVKLSESAQNMDDHKEAVSTSSMGQRDDIKMRESASNRTLKVDVLAQSWFYEVPNVRRIVSSEVVTVMYSDCDVLVDDVRGNKAATIWVNELSDELAGLSLGEQWTTKKMEGDDGVTVNAAVRRIEAEYEEAVWRRLQCSMLEFMAPLFPRWCFLLDFVRDILCRDTTASKRNQYQQRIVALCMVFDAVLIRPLMPFLTTKEEEMCPDDEDRDVFQRQVGALRTFMEAVYGVFARGIECFDLDHVDVECVSIHCQSLHILLGVAK